MARRRLRNGLAAGLRRGAARARRLAERAERLADRLAAPPPPVLDPPFPFEDPLLPLEADVDLDLPPDLTPPSRPARPPQHWLDAVNRRAPVGAGPSAGFSTARFPELSTPDSPGPSAPASVALSTPDNAAPRPVGTDLELVRARPVFGRPSSPPDARPASGWPSSAPDIRPASGWPSSAPDIRPSSRWPSSAPDGRPEVRPRIGDPGRGEPMPAIGPVANVDEAASPGWDGSPGAIRPGDWPELPDDTAQWTVAPRPRRRERDRYLDEEQRGLPWNA
ncbi:hypothetical protein ACPPVO_26555 [Dactylosporangium sp. McL0621]|uniref:hypothetical protein n=1 Tax=Dactylosporangium sp. McL0621 TaxID=3415678 RepID=UPI003CF44B5B